MGKQKKGAAAPAGRERLHKRYTLPKGCDCSEFVMRELDGGDDITIAVWMDQAPDLTKESGIALMKLEKQEAMRCALVEVDGEVVNVDGIPYAGFDGWSKKTMRFALEAFNDLNGFDMDELKKFRTGAEVVGLRSTSTPSGQGPSTDEPDDD